MGAGDFNKPSTSSLRAAVWSEITDMFAALAKMTGASSNPPDGCIRYNATNKCFEIYSSGGASWSALDISLTTIAAATDSSTVDGKNPGSANGIATLNGSTLVVEDPANAQATKAAGKICKWGASEAFECSALAATAVTAATNVTTDTIAEKTAAAGVTIDGCLVKDGSAAKANATSDGTNTIRTKIINIGDWNMNANQTVDVAHGLTFSKIRPPVQVMVRDDAGTYNYLENVGDEVTVYYINATIIRLWRKAGGVTDTASFDSTSYNRGWVSISYID